MIGQRREAAAPEVVGELGGPLQQAAVQVEDVARVRLAAGRAAQQQRKLPVRLGLLGQVVVDAQDVLGRLAFLALPHEVLADGAAGVGRDVLERRRIRRAGRDHDGVVHRAVRLERLHHAGHGRLLLADGDVDADHGVRRAPPVSLVDDRVHGDSGLARLAVADDQLALAAADGDHRVDGLDAGLERLLHRLAVGDAGGDDVELAGDASRLDRRSAVERHAQRVHHAAEQRLAGGISSRRPVDLTLSPSRTAR